MGWLRVEMGRGWEKWPIALGGFSAYSFNKTKAEKSNKINCKWFSKFTIKYYYESLAFLGFLENVLGPKYLSNLNGL